MGLRPNIEINKVQSKYHLFFFLGGTKTTCEA